MPPATPPVILSVLTQPEILAVCVFVAVFDWEGTLLETYALDTPLTHITVDVSENVLYAIGHEPQTCLMKLVLDN